MTGIDSPVTLRLVVRTWWPLAASWLLMGVEVPMLSAVVARLVDPEIHLAAYGGVVFPLALIVEAPVIMLLAASTALSRDRVAYATLEQFVHRLSAGLTALHVLVAFTPLYDLAVVRLMDVPPEVVEPARLGLQIMTPWTWSIAYRRFNQGVLIRFDHSRAVGVGTLLRLVGVVSVLSWGYANGTVSGVVVAASAVICGVVTEAIYVGLRVRPIVRTLPRSDPSRPPLRGQAFASFYVPLAMTSLITLIVLPIGSAAVSRMPAALESLAVWPVVTGLVFLLQGFGLAYNEVVVALLNRRRSLHALWQFSLLLCAGTTLILVILAGTSLSQWWFRGVTGLPDNLAGMAEAVLWITVPIPATRALQSWYQGILVHVRRTSPITESVVVFLLVCVGVLLFGIESQGYPGLTVAVWANTIGRIAQTLWLVLRSRGARDDLREADASGVRTRITATQGAIATAPAPMPD